MWVLGSGGLAQDYFPSDNPNLTDGKQVNWTLVYTITWDPQYVVLHVKLLNSSVESPNELSGTPSPVSPICEFKSYLTTKLEFNSTLHHS